MLAALFKDNEISGLDVKGATYYVPATISLAVISATTVKLATNLPAEREAGQLKRVRGTPLPPAAFVAGAGGGPPGGPALLGGPGGGGGGGAAGGASSAPPPPAPPLPVARGAPS